MEVKRYQQHDFEVPSGLGMGSYAERTRWILLRDGIANCIAHTPPGERAMITNLQYAWMECCSQLLRIEAPVEVKELAWDPLF